MEVVNEVRDSLQLYIKAIGIHLPSSVTNKDLVQHCLLIVVSELYGLSLQSAAHKNHAGNPSPHLNETHFT